LFVCELAALMTNKYAASLPLFFIFFYFLVIFWGHCLWLAKLACQANELHEKILGNLGNEPRSLDAIGLGLIDPINGTVLRSSPSLIMIRVGRVDCDD